MSLHTYFEALIYINVNGTQQRKFIGAYNGKRVNDLPKGERLLLRINTIRNSLKRNKFGYKFCTVITMKDFIFYVYMLKFHRISQLLQE